MNIICSDAVIRSDYKWQNVWAGEHVVQNEFRFMVEVII